MRGNEINVASPAGFGSTGRRFGESLPKESWMRS